jgi:hypothetical protein
MFDFVACSCADNVLLLHKCLQVMQRASPLVLLGELHWRRHVKWAANKCCWVSVAAASTDLQRSLASEQQQH